MNVSFFENNLWLVGGLLIWELVWKGFALWRAARQGEKYWFIALLLISTVGILPIVYLIMQRYRQK